jgi:hypothetical protein
MATGRNLRHWLKAYIEFTNETESPDCYHFWVGATLISAATKRQICINMNQFRIFPNLYVILVGPSGARKSIATGIGMGIAEKVGIRKFSDKITGAALIKDLSGATEKFVDQAKGEVQLCSPIMIYASELGVFLGSDAYGSGVIADLTDLYDCPSKWEKKTISRDAETVTQPFVSMLAASTPQTLKDTVPTGAVGQGFTSRIIFVWGGGRRKRVPIPPWGVEYEMLQTNLVADLKHISTLRGQFVFSDDGFKAYKDHYMAHPEPEEEYEDERFRGYASRKDIHTLKLAQIMSLAYKDELVLTAEDIKGAIDAIAWLDKGFPNIFEGHGKAANSGDVARVFRQIEIATKRFGFLPHSELVKRNYAHLNSQELAMVLQTLSDAKAVREGLTKSGRGGALEKSYQAIDPDFLAKMVSPMPRSMKDEG